MAASEDDAARPPAAEVAAALTSRLGVHRPRALITLGSGMGELADEVADAVAVEPDVVGLPVPTAPGHRGRLIAGSLGGTEVLVQQGRVHRFEDRPADEVVAAVDAAAALGCEAFVVTGTAGGLRDDQQPGELMSLTDHLNLTGDTPLSGPRFVDMGAPYDAELRALAHEAAEEGGVALADGVYAGVRGPAYETPAETAMLRTLGADAVGMSTVLEVIGARAAGLRVWGCSLITNVHRSGGTSADPEAVRTAADQAGPRLARLVRGLVGRLS